MKMTSVFLSSYWDKIAPAMEEATTNTILGITVVFGALLFFTFIISLFKYISVIENKIKAKKEGKAADEAIPAKAIENTVTQITKTETENLTDDLALVAVITAAIQAFEEENGNAAAVATAAPAANVAKVSNGLVVRSIHRIDRRGWSNN